MATTTEPIGFSTAFTYDPFLDRSVKVSAEYVEGPTYHIDPGSDATVFVSAVEDRVENFVPDFCSTSGAIRLTFDSMLHVTGRRFRITERFSPENPITVESPVLEVAVNDFAEAVARRVIDPHNTLCDLHDHDYIVAARACAMKAR